MARMTDPYGVDYQPTEYSPESDVPLWLQSMTNWWGQVTGGVNPYQGTIPTQMPTPTPEPIYRPDRSDLEWWRVPLEGIQGMITGQPAQISPETTQMALKYVEQNSDSPAAQAYWQSLESARLGEEESKAAQGQLLGYSSPEEQMLRNQRYANFMQPGSEGWANVNVVNEMAGMAGMTSTPAELSAFASRGKWAADAANLFGGNQMEGIVAPGYLDKLMKLGPEIGGLSKEAKLLKSYVERTGKSIEEAILWLKQYGFKDDPIANALKQLGAKDLPSAKAFVSQVTGAPAKEEKYLMGKIGEKPSVALPVPEVKPSTPELKTTPVETVIAKGKKSMPSEQRLLVDSETGKVLDYSVARDETRWESNATIDTGKHLGKDVIDIHTHPDNSLPSGEDWAQLVWGHAKEIRVVLQNGDVVSLIKPEGLRGTPKGMKDAWARLEDEIFADTERVKTLTVEEIIAEINLRLSKETGIKIVTKPLSSYRNEEWAKKLAPPLETPTPELKTTPVEVTKPKPESIGVEPHANEVSPKYEYPNGWTKWPEGWVTSEAEKGYHGNMPAFYVTSPSGVKYRYDNNFHSWSKISEGNKVPPVSKPIEPVVPPLETTKPPEMTIPKAGMTKEQALAEEERIDPGWQDKPNPDETIGGKFYQQWFEAKGKKTKASQMPVGTGAERESEHFRKVNERLQGELGDNPLYNQANMAEQAQLGTRIVDANEDDAYKITLGIKSPPKGVLPNAVGLAFEEKMLAKGDFTRYGEAVLADSLRGTREGQDIAKFKGAVSDNHPTHFIKQVISRRMEEVGSKLPKTPGQPTAPASRVTQRIDKHTANLNKQLKGITFELAEAQKLVDSWMCK